MVTRLLIVSTFALLSCAVAFARPSLTREQAIRIADAKARASGYNLHTYVCGPVNYQAPEDAWWVNYRKKSAKYTEFSIQVEDKTRKAWLVLP